MFKKDISKLKLPTHIGIIMDGNGRWATRQGLPRNMGHKEGIQAVDRTIDALLKFKVKIVTFFAFSTENWKRSETEIQGIFDLLRDYIKKQTNHFKEKGVRIRSMGDLSKFPADLVAELEKIKKETEQNDALIVNLALNYGGKTDIVQAVQTLLQNKENVTEESIEKYLYSHPLPNPDLIIRTSGEMRVSNFMLYQMAYSEFYFPKVMWPDYNEKHLREALIEYSGRHRRFGGIQ